MFDLQMMAAVVPHNAGPGTIDAELENVTLREAAFYVRHHPNRQMLRIFTEDKAGLIQPEEFDLLFAQIDAEKRP